MFTSFDSTEACWRVPVTLTRAGRSPRPVRLNTYGAAGCEPACYPQLSGRSEWTFARVSVVRLST